VRECECHNRLHAEVHHTHTHYDSYHLDNSHFCFITLLSYKVVRFWVWLKVGVRKLSRNLTNHKNVVCELLNVRRTLSPFLLS